MRVPADHSRKPCCHWIQIKRMPVVQHIEGVPMQRNDFCSRQVGAGTAHIDIAANSGHRGQAAQRIQNGRIADIARMQDVLHTAQSRR